MGKTKSSKPWYHEGLRFECTGCGDCCTGAPGYVWVNQAEIQAMADFVSLDIEEFERLFVRKVGVRRSLVEFSNGDCVFFDDKNRSCRIYEVRPRQCKTWPFWDSNLKSPEDWERTCEECPGSGTGKLYKLEHIEKQRQVISV